MREGERRKSRDNDVNAFVPGPSSFFPLLPARTMKLADWAGL